jgi:hypothetical protein
MMDKLTKNPASFTARLIERNKAIARLLVRAFETGEKTERRTPLRAGRRNVPARPFELPVPCRACDDNECLPICGDDDDIIASVCVCDRIFSGIDGTATDLYLVI